MCGLQREDRDNKEDEAPEKMKLVSWNVNGLRAVLKKGFEDFVKEEDPDVLCLQETKVNDDFEYELEGYHSYWCNAEKKGYSGVAVFTKEEPLSVSYELGHDGHDGEGRVLTLEFKNFFLVNVYTPNAKRDLSRLDDRQEWDKEFLNYLKNIEESKPVVFCGDLNVAHEEIDLARPKNNKRNAGFTQEERNGFTRYIENGFVDTFREFNKEGGNYSWWSYMFNARNNNIGWRIDYFCVSGSLKPGLKDASILSNVMGSDHCPVLLEIKN